MRTTGMMEVTVVGARGLKKSKLFGKVNPHVVVQYENEEQKSTSSGQQTSKFRMHCCVFVGGQRRNRSLTWNEKFEFRVEFEEGDEHEHEHEQQHKKLILKIMNKDTLSDHNNVGMATIYLKGLFEEGMETGKAELRTQKYRLVSANQTYHGEIQVGVTFTATLN